MWYQVARANPNPNPYLEANDMWDGRCLDAADWRCSFVALVRFLRPTVAGSIPAVSPPPTVSHRQEPHPPSSVDPFTEEPPPSRCLPTLPARSKYVSSSTTVLGHKIFTALRHLTIRAKT